MDIYTDILIVFIYLSTHFTLLDMSNNEAEKDEMKDEAHDLQDEEQYEQDAENEGDADFQEE